MGETISTAHFPGNISIKETELPAGTLEKSKNV